MSNKIEGIPDGWELVRFDYANDGEFYIDGIGDIRNHLSVKPTQAKRLIIRKIEKPKQYRPFANAAEFEPFRDRWFCPKIKRNHLIKTSAYNEHRHWSGEEPDTWEKMFDEYVFDDGTPFGIEVAE